MSTQRYSDAAIESVGKWLKDGFSASQIAAALGKELKMKTSRSAVIGLVHRNKVLLAVGFARPSGGASQRKASKAKERKVAGHKPAPQQTLLPQRALPPRAFLAATAGTVRGHDHLQFRMPVHRPRAENLGDTAAYDRDGRHVALADLDGGCRWPVNDAVPPEAHLFCGHPRQPGFSYCHHHRMRSVQCR